jgi:uncharacterized membrane protein
MTPESIAGYAIGGLLGIGILLTAVSIWRRTCRSRPPGPDTPADSTEGDLETQVRSLGEFERRVVASVLRRRPVSRDPNRIFDAQLTFGERMADRVAAFGGSWVFIGLFFTVMLIWMALNRESRRPFDPYPFILLNLLLSCLAALQAPIIMMSQNRQAAKDRLDAKSDYEVNLRAEMEILALHEKLDATHGHGWEALAELVAAQNERLTKLEELLAARRDN